MNLEIIGIWAALGSALSWALGSILFERLGQRLTPLAMTLAKGIVSLLLLTVVLLIFGYQGISQQALFLFILSGVLGIAISDTLFFEALQDLGAHALVMLMTFGQVFTVILAVVFLGEKLTLQQGLGITLIILGISLVLLAKVGSEIQHSALKGIILGLLAVVCMSVSYVMIKDSLEDASPVVALFIRMLAGTTGILLLGLTTGKLGRWMLPFSDLKLGGLFIFSVCVVTFGGFLLSLVAFKYLEVAIANTLVSTEPLFVLPLAVVFAKEKVSLKAVVGTFITTLGIVLLCQGN